MKKGVFMQQINKVHTNSKSKKIPTIVFINGYGGENSKKPQILSELLNLEIEFISVNYDKMDDIVYKTIVNKAKEADIIIGSSTGSYLGRKICEEYNITLISFNSKR